MDKKRVIKFHPKVNKEKVKKMLKAFEPKTVYWEWYWYWGFNQNELDLHSPKKKFTDFDKMKTYSAKHSAKHKWVGSGYWSDYETIDPKRKTRA